MKKLIAVIGAGAMLASGMCFAESAADIAGEYVFASGAGAWCTVMTINEDMSFSGAYTDSEMAETGEGYDYGSCYISTFAGTFSEPEALENGTMTMTSSELTYDEQPGTETIIDEIRYVYDEAYGLTGGDTFILYPAGYATADMEENALEWATLTGGWGFDSIPEALPNSVLYNATQGYAFTRQ